MAFIDVSTKSSISAQKANDMEIGVTIDAYVLAITTRINEDDGRKMYNLVLKDVLSGEQFILFTSGTLYYDVQDGRVKAGLRTQITKTEDRNKTNKRGQFKVLQDPDDKIEVASQNDRDELPDIGAQPQKSMQNVAAVERSAVAARAAELAKAAKAAKRP